MRYLYGLPMIALVFLAGCNLEKEPEEPVVEAPPPKTAQEIYQDYKTALNPLFAGAAANSGFTIGMKDPIISQFRTAKSQYAQEINEVEASDKIANDVSNAVKEAQNSEQWYALDGLLDVHKMLSPNSQRYDTVRRRCDLMLARPWVKVTGFAEIDKGDLITFLDVLDPNTGEIQSLKIREGEEFYPDEEGKDILRLVKVIGAQSAVELEYLRLPGETWEIPGPKNN